MHVRIDMLREIDLRRRNVCGGFSFLEIEDHLILCRVKAIMLVLHESVNHFFVFVCKRHINNVKQGVRLCKM